MASEEKGVIKDGTELSNTSDRFQSIMYFIGLILSFQLGFIIFTQIMIWRTDNESDLQLQITYEYSDPIAERIHALSFVVRELDLSSKDRYEAVFDVVKAIDPQLETNDIDFIMFPALMNGDDVRTYNRRYSDLHGVSNVIPGINEKLREQMTDEAQVKLDQVRAKSMSRDELFDEMYSTLEDDEFDVSIETTKRIPPPINPWSE